MYANAVRLMDRAVRTCGCPFPNYIAQHGSAVVVGPTRAGSPVQTKGSSSSFLRSTSSRTTNATWRNICGRAQLEVWPCRATAHCICIIIGWLELLLGCCAEWQVNGAAFGREREENMSTCQHGRSPNAWMDHGCNNGNTARNRERRRSALSSYDLSPARH